MNEKIRNINEKFRSIIDGLLIGVRFLLVTFFFCFCIAIPILFFMVKVISMLTSPLPYAAEGIVGVILFIAGILYISYLGSRGNHKLANWIQTGHFEVEISDEKNAEMRIHWLKNHDVRTKPKTFRIFLTNPTELVFLAPTYPIKFNSPDTLAEPLNYQALIPITHKFRGNLPITGDTIKFAWIATPNNDISKLHVRAVEAFPQREKKPSVWEEIDSNGKEGSVCIENLKTGKQIKITHTVKIAKDCQEGISLCFWNETNESEGESVLAYKFK